MSGYGFAYQPLESVDGKTEYLWLRVDGAGHPVCSRCFLPLAASTDEITEGMPLAYVQRNTTGAAEATCTGCRVPVDERLDDPRQS